MSNHAGFDFFEIKLKIGFRFADHLGGTGFLVRVFRLLHHVGCDVSILDAISVLSGQISLVEFVAFVWFLMRFRMPSAFVSNVFWVALMCFFRSPKVTFCASEKTED